jgi:myo-inositol-1(or 4)-monophosphatase
LVKALRAAGQVHRRGFGRKLAVSHKGPVDIVTSVDRAAERIIRRVLRGRFPDHSFLMEESGARGPASPYRWVVDPLDGTVNFAHGIPISCVSIGLEKDGRVMLGGVLDPHRDELFLAERGRGAVCNGRPIRVSRTDRLMNAVLATGFPYDHQTRAAFYLSFVRKLMEKTRGLRRLGAAALDLCWTACGRFDGYWEFNIKPWDAAAGTLIVEEAGGTVTDFNGRPYSLADTSKTLATNGRLHGLIVPSLRGGPVKK